MIIEKMTTFGFSEGLKTTKTVIVPLGSIEQHGPHLPMHTDIFHATEIARLASQMVPVFVAPPINFGVCRSTADFPGTIGIRSDTLISIVVDVVESLYRHGIRRFILYSGHAGANHMAALLSAADDLMAAYDDTDFAVINDLDLFDTELFKLLEAHNDSHAGEFETSLIMALAPDLVGKLPPADRPHFPRPLLVRNTRACWKSGVWGDPTMASREKGERMVAILTRNLAKMAESMNNQKKKTTKTS
ncbi:MAG: creatininase family protein [Deltaproteobacteria bacterium]|nr:creatininase family protein [Candidatus Zymogenaceae bacterium]